MHFVFATRGIKHMTDIFETHAQCRFWPWERYDLKTKKKTIVPVQGALRPILFWEYVFPETSKDDVLTMFNIGDGKVTPKIAQANMTLMRKALGLEKIPAYKKTNIIHIPRDGVALYPIGIKKDRIDTWHEAGFKGEML